MMGNVSGWDDDDMTAGEFDALLAAGEPAKMRRRKRPVSVIREFRIVSTSKVNARSAAPATTGAAPGKVSAPRVTHGPNVLLSGPATD